MSVTGQEQKTYIKQIKKLLICPGKQRKSFLLSFSDSMEAYLEDHSEADFEHLQAEMGTPLEIANAFLANESASRIKKHMCITRWIKMGVIAALLILVLIAVVEIIDSHSARRGYFEDAITEDSVIITEE